MEVSHSQAQAQSQRPAPVQKIHYPFWFGGSASSFAASVTHPLDLGELVAFMYLSIDWAGLTWVI